MPLYVSLNTCGQGGDIFTIPRCKLLASVCLCSFLVFAFAWSISQKDSFNHSNLFTNMFELPFKNLVNFVSRKRAACKSVNGSHKYKGNSKDVKPPDLWIHHERLELKPIDKSPDPNPIMTDTPIPRNSQDITPVDNSMDSNIHQRRNSYRGAGFPQMLGDYFHLNHFPFIRLP